jgi:uncharacterized membrane protein
MGSTHVLWTNGTLTALPKLAGATETYTSAINNFGVVAGISFVDGTVRATKWLNGQAIALATPLGESSQALDINDAGDVVGFLGNALTVVIWRANGTMQILTGLPTSGQFFPYAISNTGEVLIQSTFTAGPLLWKNGAVTNLKIGTYTTLGWTMNNTGGVFLAKEGFNSQDPGECNNTHYTGKVWRNGSTRDIYTDGGETYTLPVKLNDKDVALARRIHFVNDPFVGCTTLEERVTVFTPPPPAAIAAEISNSVDTLVSDGALSSGDAQSLQRQLTEAMERLQSGATTPGVNILGAFINKTAALVKSGRLTPAQAEQLTAAAQQAIAATRESTLS